MFYGKNALAATPMKRAAAWIVWTVASAAALSAAPPEFISQWGSYGPGNGQFLLPVAVAVDSQGHVYVADSSAKRIQKFDGTGRFMAAWGSPGVGPGRFQRPLGIAVDAADRVWVVDALQGVVQVFDASGNFLWMWGSSSETPGDGEFFWPTNVAVAPDGRAYVTDQGTVSGLWGHNVQVFDASGAFLLRWGGWGTGAGQFYHPFGIVLDEAGDVYVADSLNFRIQKFDAVGNFETSWGTFGVGDGQFDRLLGLAYDAGSGTLYVVDSWNDRIQMFDRSGAFVGSFGGRGAGAGQLDLPFAAAVDARGNVFVADGLNFRVQKFGPPALEVLLDVKPGANNKVNLNSNGLLTAAILTTPGFDAGDVDPSSLELGPGGARIFHAGGHFVDVDGDGDLDLLLHFRIPETGIACGDTSVEITGTTYSGERIRGSDSIVTQGC